MPIPSAITDLSTTPASNSPAGSETPIEGDNHLRTIYAFIKQLYDGITASGNAQLASLASAASASLGAGLLGFDTSLNYAANTAGWGIRTAQGRPSALRWMPVAEWANILNGTTNTDLTSYVQLAVDNGAWFPAGKWPISATTGITLTDGACIYGAGRNRTIFWAILGTGGSSADLVAYTAGSVFKRQFNVAPGTNAYVSSVCMADFALILNHPTASITTTAIQIGLDMRNISRSEIERVYVGNYAPSGSFVAKTDPPTGYAQQGYGVVFGNVSHGSSSYCGGEVHTVDKCQVWGAYKLIVQDDTTLSPSSGAHGVRVINCDLQAGHHGLVQESQYATGCLWQGNVIQSARKQNGDVTSSYIMRFAGYNSRIFGGDYLECGNADYILSLESTSDHIRAVLDYFSATSAALISDAGTKNRLSYWADSGSVPGGVDAQGRMVEYYDKAPIEMTYQGHWVTTTQTVDASDGMTMTRNGTGDYTVAFTVNQPNAFYTIEISMDTNGSHHGALHCISAGTKAVGGFRFFTLGQNGGTTTQLDPAKMYIRIKQAITP
jgi:hypothetical protein